MPALTIEHLKLVLTQVITRCRDDGGSFDCCLIGTAAAMLRGVPIEAGDVDLLVPDRAHVDTFARALAGSVTLTLPSWLDAARQYYAAFEIEGVKVEASTVEWPTESECLETVGKGPWTHCSQLEFGAMSIRTIAIELRLATELSRRRTDRANAILAWIRHNGCDLSLLHDAMAAQDIADDRQAAILADLQA